jgi:catechol 2,3-dioxygenase-like lactoylglutathione lyase family enzyme
MSVSQLAYLGIGVSDMPAWKSFATDILGMQVTERGDDGTVYLRMDENHHRIALHPSGEDDVLYVGLQAPTHARYEEAKSALRAAGVPVTQGTSAEIAHRRVVDFVKFETGDLPFELSIGPFNRWNPPFQPARPMSGFKTELWASVTWCSARWTARTAWGSSPKSWDSASPTTSTPWSSCAAIRATTR